MKSIAKTVGIHFSYQDNNNAKVKTWLSDKRNEPWFLVVDGLNDDRIAEQVQNLLPEDQGQTLITTKDKGILGRFKKRKRSSQTIRNMSYNQGPPASQRDTRSDFRLFVKEPRIADLRNIFDWYNDDTLTDATKMNFLLEALFLPVRVKLTARTWERNGGTTTSQRYKDMVMDKEGKQKYAPFPGIVEGVLDNVFSSLNPEVPMRGSSPWPSHELKLLALMSCLNIDQIESKILEVDHEADHREELRNMLGILENRSYISWQRNTASGTDTYSMHEFVRMAVRQFIKGNPGLGLVALLECHQIALASLLHIYREQEKKFQASHSAIQSSCHNLKMVLMPHVEPFVRFVRCIMEDEQDKMASFVEFKRTEALTYSTIIFSQALIEEGRYSDAARVLEFVKNLKGDEHHLLQLKRMLAKAYISLPLATHNKKAWEDATELLKPGVELCLQDTPDLQSWLSMIDLASLYSRSGRPVKALGVLALYGGLGCWHYKDNTQLCQQKGNKLSEQERKSIAILFRVETAFAYAVIANSQNDHQTPKVKSQQSGLSLNGLLGALDSIKRNAYRKKSKKLIKQVEEAYEKLSPGEHYSTGFTDENGMLRTWIAIGDKEMLDKARTKLNDSIRHLESSVNFPQRFGSRTRLLGMKTWKAKLDLDSDCRVEGKEIASKRLEDLLEEYREHFGAPNGKHDAHTLHCAVLLRESYEKLGQKDGRVDLTEYCLDDPPACVLFYDDEERLDLAPFVVIMLVLVVITSLRARDTLYLGPFRGDL